MADITNLYTDDKGNPIPYEEAMLQLEQPSPPVPPGPPPSNSPRGFTNRPELAGTEIAPGVPGTWEYVPGTEEPLEMTVEEQVAEAVGRERERGTERFVPPTSKLKRWAGGDVNVPPEPPEEVEIPDFSASGREEFRQHIINEYMGGMDPVSFDPVAEADKLEARYLPAYFDRFFRGQVSFRDREKLTGKMKSEWEKAYLRFRAEAHRRAVNTKNMWMDMLQDKLGRWDRQAAEFNALKKQALTEEKAARKAVQTMLEKRRSEMRRAPTVKNMVNAKGVLTVHEWDPDLRTWADTGKQASAERAPSTSAMISASRFEDNVLKDLKPGERIPPHQLSAINRHRDSLGLPHILERQVEKADKVWGPEVIGKIPWAKGLLAKKGGAAYEYTEEGTAPETGGRVNITAPSGTPDAQIKAAIEARYPKPWVVYKGTDGNWYVRK